MKGRASIAIQVSGKEDTGAYFSLRLQAGVTEAKAAYGEIPKGLVISGIQGNFRELRQALLHTGVINEKGKWSFDAGHLIIFGDSANIRTGMQECLWFIYGLEESAAKSGGAIHYLISAREIEIISNEWPHCHPRYAPNARSKSKSFAVLYDGNNELKRWLHTKNMIEKIGPYIFLNGGLPDEVTLGPLSLAGINRELRIFYSKKGCASAWQPGPDRLTTLAGEQQVLGVITAQQRDTTVTTDHDGRLINVSSILGGDFTESLKIVRRHLYRFNTNGDKEKIR